MRIIAHLDLDAFFAAVEERDKPRLRGRPIVIGADPEDGKGRGVVSTANYAARKYGIHSAMPISHAWRLAKDAERQGQMPAIFLQGSYERYSEVSERVMKIIRSRVVCSDALQHKSGRSESRLYVGVEQASVDEAYFDLTYTGDFIKAEYVCRKIKEDIRKKEKITASIGLAPNKLIAKIASDMQKPDGLTIVTADQAENFLAPLPVRKIPGIGPKTGEFLKSKGIETISDVKQYSLEELQDILGKPRRLQSGSRPQKASGWGEDIYYKARGIDNSPIVEEHEVKSIGQQETFRNDTLDAGLMFGVLKEMSVKIEKKLKHSGFGAFRTVTISVRFSDFETKSRSHTLKEPSDGSDKIYTEAMKLFMSFFDKRENPQNKAIRLIGVRVEKLTK